MKRDRIANEHNVMRSCPPLTERNLSCAARMSRDGIPASWMNADRTPFNQFGRALIASCPLLILSTTRLRNSTWTRSESLAESLPLVALKNWPLPLPSSFHSHLFTVFFGEWSRVRDNYWILTIRYEYRWAGSLSARVIALNDQIPTIEK